MRTHHKIALGLTVPWVALLGYDFAHRVSEGTGTWVTDSDLVESRVFSVTTTVAIGAMFASLAWVVHAERARFADAPRAARWARRPLLVSLIALTVGFCLVSPTQVALGVKSGLFYDISGLVAFVAISGLSLSALTVGLASVRSMALGYGGRILALILPAVLLGAAAALYADAPVSPVFGTFVALVGLATLGLGLPGQAVGARGVVDGQHHP
ncbi:MAG: hypothetical protein IPH03_02015 [Tetrasphaera sp.]|jgi:hypothetical protein|nr:hypothetical protein [Tetrasphaera sp.]